MKNYLGDILVFKFPHGGWSLVGNTIDGFKSSVVKTPTITEIETWDKEYTEFLNNNEYKNQRIKAYPAITDQLDAIWKEINNRRLNGDNLVSDADDMLGKILAVKKKYPKPK